MENFAVVEKKNHLAIHSLFYSREAAEKFVKDIIPEYVKNGYYMDKTLTKDSFEVIERDKNNRKRS